MAQLYVNIVESVEGRKRNGAIIVRSASYSRSTVTSCFVPGKTPLAALAALPRLRCLLAQAHVIKLPLEGTDMKLPTKPGPSRHARVRRAW